MLSEYLAGQKFDTIDDLADLYWKQDWRERLPRNAFDQYCRIRLKTTSVKKAVRNRGEKPDIVEQKEREKREQEEESGAEKRKEEASWAENRKSESDVQQSQFKRETSEEQRPKTTASGHTSHRREEEDKKRARWAN